MNHIYRLLPALLLLLLLLPAGLRAQAPTIIISSGNGLTGSYTGCAGTVTDPGSDAGDYPNNQDTGITLLPQTAGSRIQVVLNGFDMEANRDFLYIYDGVNANAPQLAGLTGSSSQTRTFAATNPQGALTLRFTSDATGTRAGWAAVMSCAAFPASATTGNVGVGTTQPLDKLHVAGTVYGTSGFRFPDGTVQTTASYDAQQLSLTGSTISLTNGGSVTVPVDNLGSHTATQNLRLNNQWLSNDGGNEGLRVDNDGDVGVGTATPAARLHVAGGSLLVTGDNQGLIVDEGNNRRVGLIKYAGRPTGLYRVTETNFEIGRVPVGALPGADLIFSPNDFLPDLFLSRFGDVGVGTNRPDARLDVNGYLRVRGASGTPSAGSLPNVAFLELNATMPTTAGTQVVVGHGLSDAKILGLQVLVDCGSNGQSNGNHTPPGFTDNTGELYYAYLNGNRVILRAGQGSSSSQVLGRPARILITYKE